MTHKANTKCPLAILWRGHKKTHIFAFSCPPSKTVCVKSETISRLIHYCTYAYPQFIDNLCVQYYPDPTWQLGVIPGHGICLCVHGDLYLGNKTIGQDHGKSLGNGQQ